MRIFKPSRLTSISLKTRFSIAVALLVAGTAALLTFASMLAVQRGIENVIGDSQSTLVQQVATDLDQKFSVRKTALTQLAVDLGKDWRKNSDTWQPMLEQHHSLDVLFDNFAIFDLQGVAVANMDHPEKRLTYNAFKRDYFQQALASRAATVSKPIISLMSGRPLVVVSVPVADPQGAVVAVLAATIDLGRNSFIKNLSVNRIGKTGYFYIISKEGDFVSHPNDAWLLKNTKDLPGHSPAVELALGGFEGTTRSFSGDGTEALFSFKQIQSTDWIVAAVYPAKEAFAPAGQVRSNAIFICLILVFVLAPVAWWMIDRQLLPLQTLRGHMLQTRRNPSLTLAPVDYKHDEIGDLGRVFDDLMRERQRAERSLAASEKSLRTLTDNMPALISYVDTDFRYRFCNSAYKVVPDIDPLAMVGRTVEEVFGADHFARVGPKMAEALAGKAVSFELPVRARGLNVHLHYDYIPDIGDDGEVLGFYSMIVNTTLRKQAELNLASRENLLRAVTDNLPALVSFIDLEGRFQFANRPHEVWFGRPLDQIVGHLLTELMSPAELDLRRQYFDSAMSGQTIEFGFEKAIAGELRHFHATYIPQTDAAGAIMGVSCMVNDVTDAKLLEQQLSALARFDTLTGLANRNQLNERISDAVERSARTRRMVAVMYLDLDNFKVINDSFGHHSGDAVLKEFARRLRACVRQTDTVGRLAGDEFVILLEGLLQENESTLVAQKIVQAMERSFDIDGVPRFVTTSIGIAVSHGQKVTADDMLRKADTALYRAKEAGRNTYISLLM